jgi:hypothetical protein
LSIIIKKNEIELLQKLISGNSNHIKNPNFHNDFWIVTSLWPYGCTKTIDYFMRNGLAEQDDMMLKGIFNLTPLEYLFDNKRLGNIIKYFGQYYPKIFKILTDSDLLLKNYKDGGLSGHAIKALLSVGALPTPGMISLLLKEFVTKQEIKRMDACSNLRFFSDTINYRLTPIIKSNYKTCGEVYSTVMPELLEIGAWRALIPWLMVEQEDRPKLLPKEGTKLNFDGNFSFPCNNQDCHNNKSCCCYYYCGLIGKLWPMPVEVINADSIGKLTTSNSKSIKNLVKEIEKTKKLYNNFKATTWKCLPLETNKMRLLENSEENSKNLIDFRFGFK